MTRTLFVTDLDGTLLARDGHLSPASREGLVRMLDDGLEFTVATARSVVSMRGALGPLPLRLPVVGFNGGFISDLGTGRHFHVFPLDDAAARAAYALAADAGLGALVSTHTPDGDRVYLPEHANDGVAMYVAERRAHADPRLRPVPDPAIGLDETVTCLTVIARRADIVRLAGDMDGDALRLHVFDDLYTTGWTWLTAHAATATKGNAVTTLMRDAGLSGHRVVAFGDQLNDLSMFAMADHAVAPSNAVPEVLEAADEVIGHHHDDAVVRWVMANR